MRSDYDGENSISEQNTLRVIRKWQIRDLVGRLLTYVEATYTDRTQREAQKDIIRSIVYPWFEQECKWDEITEKVDKFITEQLSDESTLPSPKVG
jgi:hypothetical protein